MGDSKYQYYLASEMETLPEDLFLEFLRSLPYDEIINISVTEKHFVNYWLGINPEFLIKTIHILKCERVYFESYDMIRKWLIVTSKAI